MMMPPIVGTLRVSCAAFPSRSFPRSGCTAPLSRRMMRGATSAPTTAAIAAAETARTDKYSNRRSGPQISSRYFKQ